MVWSLQVVRNLLFQHGARVSIANSIPSLAPKYEELGSLFEDHSSLVTIAKVDATANDVPDEIQGFPTIKLYRAGEKSSPIEYSGARTVEDLAKFISENGSHKVDPHSAAEDDDAVETDGLPNQAPAASEASKGVKDKIKSKVVDAADAAATAILDSDDDSADAHDEL